MNLIKSFKKYLTEASVGSKQANRAAALISNVVSKRIGEKVYRFGGPNGFQYYGKGVGYLYFSPSGKAFRLNNEKGEFVSVSIWKKFKLQTKADFTADFRGLNVIQLVDTLADIIQNPRVENVPVDMRESSQSFKEALKELELNEARRVSVEEFERIIKQNLNDMEDPTSLKMSRIKEIANANNISVPTAIYKNNRTGRGLYSVESSTAKASGAKPSRSGKDDLFIKVTAQDKETKKFVSVRDSKDAQDMTKKIRQFLEDPNEEVIEKELEHPDTLFGKMSSLTSLILRGIKKSFVIYGGPGVGKSFVVKKTIDEYGLEQNKDWFEISGTITTASLYKTLFMHRDGKLLLFDDTDSVWDTKDSANILKAALDSYDERVISWNSAQTIPVAVLGPDEREKLYNEIDEKLRTDPEGSKIKYPSEFPFTGRIIFISNLSRDKFDTAVLSRSVKIDMTLTQEQIWLRIKSIIEHIQGDHFKDVPIEAKQAVLEELPKIVGPGKNIEYADLRTYKDGIDLYMSGDPNWVELLPYM